MNSIYDQGVIKGFQKAIDFLITLNTQAILDNEYTEIIYDIHDELTLRKLFAELNRITNIDDVLAIIKKYKSSGRKNETIAEVHFEATKESIIEVIAERIGIQEEEAFNRIIRLLLEIDDYDKLRSILKAVMVANTIEEVIDEIEHAIDVGK